ncbi:chromosome-associated kinesin KIF4A-like [Anabrus simplex]|uniref:chromosome-associated kinesin KIF4A-like n=1 Tax=Anabrus simplex TaxID=316456 RepID=UPI0035A35A3A
MPEKYSTVEVALRVRPLVCEELTKGCKICLEQIPNTPQVRVIGSDLAFTYNYVFGPDTKQEYFYNTCVKGLVTKLFEGYNVTVLAYGQTSSGKTFSMGTSCLSGENMGVIQRAVVDIFDEVRVQTNFKFTLRVSYMELYQEQLFDLLAPNKATVDIREDGKGMVRVPRLTEVNVNSPDHAMALLTQGSTWRTTGSTTMNIQSSRSHAIFTINIYKQDISNPRLVYTSKFHFVDLAGSERQNKCKSSGERLRESISINRGLLALGNVISALGDDSPKGHITYRDSKLTRLLQDSLGGNSLTLLIACVSPADYNESETISTLRYADRAKRIKNKPIINVEGGDGDTQIIKFKKARLRRQISALDGTSSRYPVESDERYTQLVRKIEQLIAALNYAYEDIMNLAQSNLSAELERDRIKTQLKELQYQYENILQSVNENGISSLSGPSAVRLLLRLKRRIKDLQLGDRHTFDKLRNIEKKYGGLMNNCFETLPNDIFPPSRKHCACCVKQHKLSRSATSPGRFEQLARSRTSCRDHRTEVCKKLPL